MRITFSTEPLYTASQVNEMLFYRDYLKHRCSELQLIEEGKQDKHHYDVSGVLYNLRRAKEVGLHTIWPWGGMLCELVEELMRKHFPSNKSPFEESLGKGG